MKDIAVKHYHGAERYNCAQAVLKSAEKYLPPDPALLHTYRKAGGGGAPDGLCGALLSAKELMKDEADRARALHYFQTQAGSVRCREIRKEGRMSCRECVASAADLAEQSLTRKP